MRASYSATVTDIDFDRLMICPRRQADDRTRVLRELKTKKSRTAVPITHETATVLRNYLRLRWRANPQGLLFPNRIGRPGKRANIVKFGLHPILKQLGLPTHRAGLHAFRHVLGTALPIRGHRPQSCSAPYATASLCIDSSFEQPRRSFRQIPHQSTSYMCCRRRPQHLSLDVRSPGNCEARV